MFFDLKGKKIAVLKGSINAEGPESIKELVKSYNINSSFIDADSYTKVFELVARGEADAGVVTKDFGYQYETDYKVLKSAVIFQPIILYFAFPKSTNMTTYLVERNRSRYESAEGRQRFNLLPVPGQMAGAGICRKTTIPVWLIWSLTGVGGLAVLLAAGSFILRSQVRSRTLALTSEINTRRSR